MFLSYLPNSFVLSIAFSVLVSTSLYSPFHCKLKNISTYRSSQLYPLNQNILLFYYLRVFMKMSCKKNERNVSLQAEFWYFKKMVDSC